jgi:hypothetical protein
MLGGRRISGTNGFVLTSAEATALRMEERRALRRYLFTTTFVQDRHIERTDPLLEGILDAADECPHGNLPHNNRCHCWQTTQETT